MASEDYRGYAGFSALGTVTEREDGSTQGGLEFVRVVIKTGEYNGQAQEFEATWWGPSSAGVLAREGDVVAMSGRVKSNVNQRGYRNARVTGQVCTIVEQGPGHVAAPEANAEPELDGSDIPF